MTKRKATPAVPQGFPSVTEPTQPTIERVKLANFRPATVNPNKGTPGSVPLIEHNIEMNGAGRPMLADKKGEMIGGSHSVQAFINKGYDEAIVVKHDGSLPIIFQRTNVDIDSPQGRSLQIGDNRTSELGYLADEIVLREMLEQIGQEDARFVEAAGYDAEDIRALVDGLQTQTYANDFRGETPDEKLDTYLNATIKQVVLLFDNDTYDDVIQRLAVIRKREMVETNTLAFLKILEVYEYHNG